MDLAVQSAFFDACRQGNLEQLESLHIQYPDLVNISDVKGFTPLIIAVYNHQPEIVKYLLENRADVAGQDASGNTALMGASFKGYKDIVPVLLAAGADINQRNYQGATALTFAATFGQMETATLLLQKGADKYAEDVRGKSPLDHAVMQENIAMVDLLEGFKQN